MIWKIFGLLGCLFGKHLRSIEDARFPAANKDLMKSKCTFCGVPMKRLAKRRWVVDPGE